MTPLRNGLLGKLGQLDFSLGFDIAEVSLGLSVYYFVNVVALTFAFFCKY